MHSNRSCFRFLFAIAFICLCGLNAASSPNPVSVLDRIEFLKDTLPLKDSVFEKTDKPATPDTVAWRKYIEKNLGLLMLNAMKEGMEAGIYTINVRFVVEKDGSITDVHALDNPKYGKKDVEKIIRTGPRWTAAEINGEKVRSYRTQSVTFKILYNPRQSQ